MVNALPASKQDMFVCCYCGYLVNLNNGGHGHDRILGKHVVGCLLHHLMAVARYDYNNIS